MEYREIIFNLALLVMLGCVAELYVRMKGIGANVEKRRGVVIEKKPKLAPPFLLLICSIIVAALNFPR